MYLLMLKYIKQPDVSCKMQDLWFSVKLDSKNEKKKCTCTKQRHLF